MNAVTDTAYDHIVPGEDAKVQFIAFCAVPNRSPWGGPRWTQTEGYPIWDAALRHTELAIYRALDHD